MSHKVIDRPECLVEKEAGRRIAASIGDDEDAPQLNELLGVAVAAYLTLGLVLDLVVAALHL